MQQDVQNVLNVLDVLNAAEYTECADLSRSAAKAREHPRNITKSADSAE